VNVEPLTNPDPSLPPAPVDPVRQRARNRRVLSALLALVVLLALFTFGYVWFYARVLRDPEAPPSVLADNPRVRNFEIVLVGSAVLVLGFGLTRLLKRKT
jgi:uncharacterized iron-regulated membrane protein